MVIRKRGNTSFKNRDARMKQALKFDWEVLKETKESVTQKMKEYWNSGKCLPET